MGYDSKGILVLNLKYEHAISFVNLVKGLGAIRAKIGPTSDVDKIFSENRRPSKMGDVAILLFGHFNFIIVSEHVFIPEINPNCILSQIYALFIEFYYDLFFFFFLFSEI
jgi:hypothetical protein